MMNKRDILKTGLGYAAGFGGVVLTSVVGMATVALAPMAAPIVACEYLAVYVIGQAVGERTRYEAECQVQAIYDDIDEIKEVIEEVKVEAK